MSKVRYGSSFLVSSIIYIAMVSIYFNIIDRPKVIQKPKEQRIKISVITPPPPPKKVEPKPIIKPTPPPPKVEPIKPKPKKKIVKKPKTKPKHKPKKIVKKVKKVVKQKVKRVIKPKKVALKPKVVKEIIEPIPIAPVEPKRAISEVKVVKNSKPLNDLSAKKREFLKSVRESIYSNKRYPLRAKRRNIQGRIHVTFDILADGDIVNIRVDDGPRVLKKEVRRALRKSFPIDIPPSISSEFPMRNISVNIDFKLKN